MVKPTGIYIKPVLRFRSIKRKKKTANSYGSIASSITGRQLKDCFVKIHLAEMYKYDKQTKTTKTKNVKYLDYIFATALHVHVYVLCFKISKKGYTRLAAASEKVYQLLAHGRWFSPGTPVSSTTKTARHDIAESGVKTPEIKSRYLPQIWQLTSRSRNKRTTNESELSHFKPQLYISPQIIYSQWEKYLKFLIRRRQLSWISDQQQNHKFGGGLP